MLISIAGVVILTLFPADLPLIRGLGDHAVSLILILVLLGLFFLMINRTRLLFACFAGAAILALFLKNFSNLKLNFDNEDHTPGLIVSNYNLINIQSDYEAFIGWLSLSESQILSFQEVDPGWNRLLKKALKSQYPYVAELTRIDGFGKMLLSRVPFGSIDTFYFQQIPNLHIRLDWDNTAFHLVSTQIVPPYRTYMGLSSREHLEMVGAYIQKLDGPVILAGEFNQVYWSKELRNLVESTHLQNSRQFIAPLNAKVPHEHIFYTRDLECIEVSELYDPGDAHIGLRASFRTNKNQQIGSEVLFPFLN